MAGADVAPFGSIVRLPAPRSRRGAPAPPVSRPDAAACRGGGHVWASRDGMISGTDTEYWRQGKSSRRAKGRPARLPCDTVIDLTCRRTPHRRRDPERADSRTERRLPDAEHVGSAAGPHDTDAALPQAGDGVLRLRRAELLLREDLSGGPAAGGKRGVHPLDPQLGAFGYDQGALHHVLQFAQVAGPGIGDLLADRAGVDRGSARLSRRPARRRKCAAISGVSSVRSRSLGGAMGKMFRKKYKSWWSRAATTSRE